MKKKILLYILIFIAVFFLFYYSYNQLELPINKPLKNIGQLTNITSSNTWRTINNSSSDKEKQIEDASGDMEQPINYSFYETEPKTIDLNYFDFVVYRGVNDYLEDLPDSIYYYPDEEEVPTAKDFILRDLNEEVQREFLMPLVEKIKSERSGTRSRARMAVRIVQDIPYDDFGVETDNIELVYPYETLYNMKGVCGDKSVLLAFLLRELGFDIVIFEFEFENHRAVGIRCSEGNYNSDYCFIETTYRWDIGEIPSRYEDGLNIKGAVPEIIHISDGISFD